MFKKAHISSAISVLVGGGLLVTASFSANAQDAGLIEVTGSRIKRIDAEGALPVQTITREEIDRRGVTTTNELINKLTSIGTGSFAESQNAGNSFAPGTAGASLRGLGSNATLILVNGRRVANYAFSQNITQAFVDLNSVPLSAIQRVEILKDGASAIYGSDALAGVINIILRKDYKGLSVTADAGGSKQGGASERGLTVTGGFGDIVDQKFNIFGSLSVYNRNALMGNMRDFSSNPDQRANGGYDFRSPTGNPGTWLTGQTAASGMTNNVVFPSCPESARATASDGRITCTYNFAADNPLLPDTQRTSVFTRGTFALKPNLTAYVELSQNSNTTNNSAAPTPGGASLPVGHVSNPYSFPVSIRYRYTEVGPRLNKIETDSTSVLAALQGDNFGWNWETGVSQAKSNSTNLGSNYISQTALTAAIPSYNFANIAAVPKSVIDGLRINTTRLGESTITAYDFKASRDLFKLAGGNAGLAVGLDRREESLLDKPDANTLAGNVVGSGGTQSTGQRSSNAVYGELVLPLFKNFEAQLAARHDNYSDFGGATTPKASFSYKADDTVKFRGGIGKGFRAPSLVQMYLGQSFSFPSISDVIRCDAYKAAETAGTATTAERTTACTAGQYRTELGGNPSLKAEESVSRSLGMIFEPTRNLSMIVDLWGFEHTNKIDSLTSSYILRNADALSAAAGRSIVNRQAPSARDVAVGAPGALRGFGADTGTAYFSSYFNAQKQLTNGIDVELRYRNIQTDLGRLGLQTTVTKVNSFKRQTSPGGALVQYNDSWGYPTTRASSVATLDNGDFRYTLVNNYVSSYGQYYGVGPQRVGRTSTFDAQVQYNGIKDTRISFGGRNITNKKPSWADVDWYGYDSSNYDPRGAFWYLKVNRTFK